jgi:uncharacterized protein CbrC (UPF0167 family)
MLKVRNFQFGFLYFIENFTGLENGSLKTNPDEIVEKVADRADLYSGFIQENYLEFFPDIQSALKCAENLEVASRLATDSVSFVYQNGINLLQESNLAANCYKSNRLKFTGNVI